jgi:hypothetical protein
MKRFLSLAALATLTTCIAHAHKPSKTPQGLPHANHFVFFSNEGDVLREVNAFLGSLP